jgi:hypothetical protein
MEKTGAMEIVQAIAEAQDKDGVLRQYLDGCEEDTKLSQLLALLSAHQDNNELVDGFVIHTWEYIEKNPTLWQHQYRSLDELKDKIGYVETVLPCLVRQSDSIKRIRRETRSVVKMWNVCVYEGRADDAGASFGCISGVAATDYHIEVCQSGWAVVSRVQRSA